MIWAPRPELKHLGRVLGIGTLIALALYFALEYWLLPGDNPYTLLWAEWVGLVLDRPLFCGGLVLFGALVFLYRILI
jgi:hypothetical protein